jgi:hypothetical protein
MLHAAEHESVAVATYLSEIKMVAVYLAEENEFRFAHQRAVHTHTPFRYGYQTRQHLQ